MGTTNHLRPDAEIINGLPCSLYMSTIPHGFTILGRSARWLIHRSTWSECELQQRFRSESSKWDVSRFQLLKSRRTYWHSTMKCYMVFSDLDLIVIPPQNAWQWLAGTEPKFDGDLSEKKTAGDIDCHLQVGEMWLSWNICRGHFRNLIQTHIDLRNCRTPFYALRHKAGSNPNPY